MKYQSKMGLSPRPISTRLLNDSRHVHIAVSYTHLDVYKRQVLGSAGVSVWGSTAGSAACAFRSDKPELTYHVEPLQKQEKREGYIFISSSKATGLAGTELA